jgi:hypothetical protein
MAGSLFGEYASSYIYAYFWRDNFLQRLCARSGNSSYNSHSKHILYSYAIDLLQYPLNKIIMWAVIGILVVVINLKILHANMMRFENWLYGNSSAIQKDYIK